MKQRIYINSNQLIKERQNIAHRTFRQHLQMRILAQKISKKKEIRIQAAIFQAVQAKKMTIRKTKQIRKTINKKTSNWGLLVPNLLKVANKSSLKQRGKCHLDTQFSRLKLTYLVDNQLNKLLKKKTVKKAKKIMNKLCNK